MALADGDIHAYEIEDLPGARLCVGYPHGRNRPALWIVSKADGGAVMLAQFHGEREAQIAINFLDETIGQINRVIQHYRLKNGEIDL